MASAEEPGIIRLKFSDNEESSPLTVFEAHTKMISGAAVTYPTGETLKAMPRAGQLMTMLGKKCRGRIVAYFKSDAADTVESEESALHVPVIVLDEKTMKVVGNKILTFNSMTGFTAAGTVDVVCSAGVEQRIAYEEVPRGLLYMINPNAVVHAYMGDDTA